MMDAHPLLPDCPRPYWRDLDSNRRAQAAIAASVEELLAVLTEVLDGERRHTPRFWRMALAPCLWPLLGHVFDRAAVATAGAAPVPPAPPESQIAFSARELIDRLCVPGELTLWLDRCVDWALAAGAVSALPSDWAALRSERRGRGKRTPEAVDGWRARLRRALLFWEGDAQIGHYAAPFTHGQSFRLALLSRGRIRRLPCPERPARRVYDGARRAALHAAVRTRLTSPLAVTALPALCALLPTAYVEQLDELQAWARRRRAPRVVVSALGNERSPYFCALADRTLADGGSVVGIQHGGYYGMTEPTWYEIVENQISDRYWTWGYRQQAGHEPMPAVRLTQCELPARAPSFGRRLLWAHGCHVSGATVLSAIPHFRREAELNDYLVQGLAAARQRLDFEIALRPYPRAGIDALVAAWQAQVPALRVEPANGRSLLAHGAEHDLSLFGFPGATGYLEFIHAERPALLFCPPELAPVRPEAQAAFDRLIAADLYATDAAAFERILGDYLAGGEAWWMAPQRVAARAAFRAEFAQAGSQPLQTWARTLLDYAARGRAALRAERGQPAD